ncbi:hypothetical protein IW262DRAFT_1466608 [Armillaria fumosa]|nr:hypothetical protein IW262DRAFT_1466608 [Armillaria fumosa]
MVMKVRRTGMGMRDVQGVIVAPVFVQASIPALLAYANGIFKLDSKDSYRIIPKTSTDPPRMSRNTSSYITSCYLGIGSTPPSSQRSCPSTLQHDDTPHQDITTSLPLCVLRCWADRPLKPRDALMKISDPDPSAVDFSPAEREAHDEELRDRVQYQVWLRLAVYMWRDGQGWVS